MKKRLIGTIGILVLIFVLLWSAMVLCDYIRASKLKPPLFATSIHLNQHGAGYYDGIGYGVRSVSKAFNGGEHILYDMRFSLFGRGKGGKRTLYDGYNHNLGLMGKQKEDVLAYMEALKLVTPDVLGNQETYTEYIEGNDVKVMNLFLYHGVVAGFEYEYHNLDAAYAFAKRLRQDLFMTFGEKNTYPNVRQTNRDYFDNIQSVSQLKAGYTYYEDWFVGLDYGQEDTMKQMLGGKPFSRMNIRMQLFVADSNKALVSAKFQALP